MKLFETGIFKYYVDLNAYVWHDQKVTEDIFEKFVKKFESNVNVGMGAYFAVEGSKIKFTGKPSMEFLAGSGGISWGGETGAEITFSKANPAAGSWSDQAWVDMTANLALHEYGHHETTMSTRLLSGASAGQFDSMKR